MNPVSAHIPLSLALVLWAACGILFIFMFRHARWAMLKDRANLNVFLAATVAVLGLWLIKTGIKPGLNFHLLGATALTLMFRPWFALLAISLICAAVAIQSGQLNAFPANLLLLGGVPVALSWSIYRFVDGRLNNHMFVYIFLNGFFGAALSVGGVGLASTLFAAGLGVYPMAYLLENYLPYFLLIAWSEAFATGMIITLLVVYRPEWVATFDDRRYLHGK